MLAAKADEPQRGRDGIHDIRISATDYIKGWLIRHDNIADRTVSTGNFLAQASLNLFRDDG